MPKRGKQQKSMARGINKANVSLQSIASVLDQQTQQINQLNSASATVADDKGGGSVAAQMAALAVAKMQLDAQKEASASLKKISASQEKQIQAMMKANQNWKGFGDKFKDFKTKMADAFDPTTIKKKLLGPFTMFKGVRDKIEDLDYIKRNKALRPNAKMSELKADAVTSRTSKENALRAQSQIDRLRRLGANDTEIKNSQAMQQRTAALNTYNSVNSGKSAKDAANPMGGNTAGTTAPSPVPNALNKMGGNVSLDTGTANMAAHEAQIEQLKVLNSQTDLLQQIASNTAAMAGKRGSAAGGSEDTAGAVQATEQGGGGGFMGKIGNAIGGIGQGLGKALGGVISGIFTGLATGLAALANPLTLVGLTAVTLAIMGIGKALEMAAPAFAAIAPVLTKVADVFQNVFLAAINAIPDVIGAIGDVIMGTVGAISDAIVGVISAVTDSVTQLSKIDGSNMLSVAAGLTAIGASLVAFGTGEVFAGITGLVSNLLSFGQDNPMEKLQKLADMGDKLNQSAAGIRNIGDAMKSFGKLDSDSLDAVSKFPWDKATKFVAAGGAMSAPGGGSVYNASKANADNAAANMNKGGGNTVTTQVNQNSTSTSVAKGGGGARNTESSYSKYLAARY